MNELRIQWWVGPICDGTKMDARRNDMGIGQLRRHIGDANLAGNN